jgi:hypothetical protein
LALFFSTVFTTNEPWVTRRRARPKTKTAVQYFQGLAEKEVPVPAFGDFYNFHKGGVDRGDQLRSYYAWARPIRRSHHYALFLDFLLEVVLINTFHLQRYFPGPLHWKRCLDQYEWRRQLYNVLFETYGHRGSKAVAGQKRKADADNTDPVQIPAAEHRRGKRATTSDCQACKGKTIYSVRRRAKRTALQSLDLNTVSQRRSTP